MSNYYQRMFTGFILILLDFTIEIQFFNIPNYKLDILPDFIGLLMIASGSLALCKETEIPLFKLGAHLVYYRIALSFFCLLVGMVSGEYSEIITYDSIWMTLSGLTGILLSLTSFAIILMATFHHGLLLADPLSNLNPSYLESGVKNFILYDTIASIFIILLPVLRVGSQGLAVILSLIFGFLGYFMFASRIYHMYKVLDI